MLMGCENNFCEYFHESKHALSLDKACYYGSNDSMTSDLFHVEDCTEISIQPCDCFIPNTVSIPAGLP